MGAAYEKLEPKIFERIAKTLRHATPILDVGCGDGRLTNFLAAKLRRKVIGVDISDFQFDEARKQAELKGISHLVRYEGADAGKLNMFGAETFGGIASVYALHEFQDPQFVLREMGRVLKTNGTIVIVDFIKGGEAERLWGERYYTPEEIESMIKRSGFKKKEMDFLYEDIIFVLACKRKRMEKFQTKN